MKLFSSRHLAAQAILLGSMLAITTPASAERQPCDGLECLLVVPAAIAYMGVVSLKPTPPIVSALVATKSKDNQELAKLIKRYPELTHSSNRQIELLRQGEIKSNWRVEDNYIVLDAKTNDGGMIQGYLSSTDTNELERRLKLDSGYLERIDNGYVLLKENSERGNLEAVRMLLDAGVPANIHHNGALLYARNGEIAQLLVERGASPKDVDLDKLGKRLLSQDLRIDESGYTEVLSMILDAYGETEPNFNSAHFISTAAERKMPGLVSLMLKHGANPNGEAGRPPLTLLLKSCDLTKASCVDEIKPAIRDLINSKADLNLAEKINSPHLTLLLTPLLLVTASNNPELIDMLKSAGAR